MSALQNKQKAGERVLPFVTEYRPSVPYLKNILMSKWHLIENQPLLTQHEILNLRTRNDYVKKAYWPCKRIFTDFFTFPFRRSLRIRNDSA